MLPKFEMPGLVCLAARRGRRKRKKTPSWVLAVSSAGLPLLFAPAASTMAQSLIQPAAADLRAVHPSHEAVSASNARSASNAQLAGQPGDSVEPIQGHGRDPGGLRPVQIVDGYVMLGYGEVRDAENRADQMGFTSIDWNPAIAWSVAMTRAVQPSACQVKVLNAVNSRFPDAHLTLANLLPGDPHDRRLSLTNVNFGGTPRQLASLSSGRYAPHRHALLGFLIGYGPSLHIVSRPTWLDPHALVFSTTSFTAHLDSAWADHPIGVFLHLVIDVLRPRRRNPCP
jgi:hypothetical protein